MSAGLTFVSPINFKMGRRLVHADALPEPEQRAFEEVREILEQIVLALTTYCGVGPRNQDQWSLLAGKLDTVLSGNLNRLYVEATENIVYGALVSLYASGGVTKVRNANATTSARPADGFCSTTGGILSGDVGEITIHSGVAEAVGATIGTRYYLSSVNGQFSAAAPALPGNIEQYAGICVEPDKILVNLHYWIQH